MVRYKPYIDQGKSPSDMAVTCPTCGAVRYYCPYDYERMKATLCKRCNAKAKWAKKIALDKM